jgi:AraC-like DNA-binding protein
MIRAFGRVMGVPPYAYFTVLRLNRARHLLHGDASVSVVAQECGFSDQSHLTRAFKRAMGMPPGHDAHAVQPTAPV